VKNIQQGTRKTKVMEKLAAGKKEE